MQATPWNLGPLARAAAACLAMALIPSAGALAQETAPSAAPKAAPIKLQLNRLEPAGESCRTYLLVDNSQGTALKSLKVDLFAFDQEGVAQKRIAVELGPLPDKKTSVKIFDFTGISCPKIGRVLLNDVLACEGGEASRETCLERTETETKTSVPLDR
ncbi:Tat pathway signal protein [Methylobacterium planeticum]|uniref:Tat pathway signal protein n=2 Tax=Methylobacterium planeticum TaxID=2615211 RepID=A0A6N6MWP2_9HYPH|nr:Tat pathway signal protein [Methylobacterium planeticum]KAB1076327.1 Tat pathway signal protein [Methylobacterium planeticum]